MPPLDQPALERVATTPTPPCVICRRAGHCISPALQSARRVVTLAPGDFLFTRDQPMRSVHVMRVGMLCLSRDLQDGRRQVTAFAVDGIPELPTTRMHELDAQAITETTLCAFPVDRFRAAMDDDAGLAGLVAGLAGEELSRARDHQILLGRKTALEKLASFLLSRVDDQDRLALPMTRHDLADHLGLTVETVSRTMTLLRRNGLIAMDTAQILRLNDRAALAGLRGEGDSDPA